MRNDAVRTAGTMTRAGALLSMCALAGLFIAAAQEPAPSASPEAVRIAAPAPGDSDRPRTAGGARLRPDQPIPRAELEAFVDGVVGQAMATHHLVGASVAVVQGGEIAMTKGYGFADLEGGRRVDPDTTLFRIGSITKTFTWIALMKAVEAERIGLDDPVNDHLPAELQIPNDGFAEPIRVRHLPAHAAGFEVRDLGGGIFPDADGIRSLTNKLREARPRRVREAGRLSSYSNYGAALAGGLLEHIHGRPWQDLIEADIIGPLALTHTSVREPYPARDDLPAPMSDQLAANLSKGYRWSGTGNVAGDFEYITSWASAGVISSTAGDMARYMLMLLDDGSLDGVRVFGPKVAAALRTPTTNFPPAVGNWSTGFETRQVGGFTTFAHDGLTTMFISRLLLVPELRLGVFVSLNTAGGDVLAGTLARRVVEDFYAPPAGTAAGGVRDIAALARAVEGHYLMTYRAYGGLEGFLGRLQTSRVTVTPDGYLMTQEPGRTQRFAPTEDVDVFRSIETHGLMPWTPGVLVRREGDRAVRLESYQFTLERVGPLFQPQTLVVTAIFAVVASLGTLVGARVRAGRALPETDAQRLASRLQLAAALAWLVSVAGAGVFVLNSDVPTYLFDWPPRALLVFSAAALVATVATLGAVLLLVVWRAPRDTPGWTRWRTWRFALCLMAFVAFGSVLAAWGALQPWNP